MSNIIQLKRATYKGVDLLFETTNTTGGNRLIKYNYAGSDSQAIEVQGKAPRSFTMNVWIPHNNYYQVRDNILRVLEDQDYGVLVHPTFGTVDNVINGVYTLTEQISELGRGKITIPFEVNDSSGIPTQSSNIIAQLSQQLGDFSASIANDVADFYSVTLSYPQNFSDALANVQSIGDSFLTASTIGEPIAGQFSKFVAQTNNLKKTAGDLIQAPASLADSLGDIFESMSALYESPSDSLLVMRGLFDFGANDPVVNPSTVGRVERKDNRDILRGNMRSQALGAAYLAAAEITYETTDALDSVQNILEEQYVDIRNNQILSNSSREQMDRVRVIGQKILGESRVTTRSTITIETQLTPLSVLVYLYYGHTDFMDTIASLNNINQNAFVEGEVLVLTQ